MIKIGLTGGIGAGKSEVSSYLKQKGAFIIDADLAAREVVKVGTRGYDKIVACFGRKILQENGELDRKKLARIVFSNKDALEKLNQITHPEINFWMEERMQEIVQKHPDAVIVYDVPLLIEGGMYKTMDQVWVVTAQKDIRIQRIMNRDHCTMQDAVARINNQFSDEERNAYADVLLDNSQTRELLYQQIDSHYQLLKKELDK